MSSYYIIGEGGFSDITITLYEWADSQPAQVDFTVFSWAEMQGQDTEDIYLPHLPKEVQFRIQDIDGHYFNKLDGAAPRNFKVVIMAGAVTVLEGYALPRTTDFTFWKKYGKIDIICTDGVTTLGHEDSPYTDKTPIGDLFYDILQQTGLDLPLNMVFELEHQNAAGQNGIIPNRLRIDPVALLRGLDAPKLYDLLMRMLERYKLQLYQVGGEWWITQRDIRTGPSVSKYRYDGSSWASSTFNPQVAITESALRAESDQDTVQYSLQPLTRIDRVAHFDPYEFYTVNPDFTDWTSGSPDGWNATGAISQISPPPQSGLRLESNAASVSQVISRVVTNTEQIGVDIDLEYQRASGLAVGDYEVGLVRIRAKSYLGSDIYLNNDGTWTTTEAWLSDEFSSAGGNPGGMISKSWSFDADVFAQPTFFGIVDILLAVGLDANAAEGSDPVDYFKVDVLPVQLNSPVEARKFYLENETIFYRNNIEEQVFVDDESRWHQVVAEEYYDGSEWIASSDFAGEADNQSLHGILIQKHISGQLSKRQAFRHRLDYNFEVTVNDTILFTVHGVEKEFIPVKTYKRKQGQDLLHEVILIEHKYETAPDVFVMRVDPN